LGGTNNRSAPNRPTPCPISPEDLLETSGEAFFALERDLTIRYANGRALAFWGITLDDCVGRSPFRVFPELAASDLQRTLRMVLADGDSRKIETSWRAHGPRVALVIHLTSSGLLIWFHETSDIRPSPTDSDGRHEALELSESSSGIGVWDVDLRTQTVRGTEQFFRIVGLPPATHAISMETMRRLRLPEDQKRVAHDYERALASGEDFFESEYRIRRPDGQAIHPR
jgi:PAS domain-containing protein